MAEPCVFKLWGMETQSSHICNKQALKLLQTTGLHGVSSLYHLYLYGQYLYQISISKGHTKVNGLFPYLKMPLKKRFEDQV